MIKPVIYVRLSNEERDGGHNSVDRQRAVLLAHAEAQGWPVPEVLVDDGYSGGNERRPQWQRLQAMLKAGLVTHLLVTDISRLFRDLEHALRFRRVWLVKRRVNLVTIHQSFAHTPDGALSYSVTALLDEQHRVQTSYKTSRAMAYRRERGLKTGGCVPYGWNVVEGGQLVPNDTERAVVALMLELHAGGMGWRSIAVTLAQRGVPTKTGLGWWQPRRVKAIVEAEAARREAEDEEAS